MSEDRTITFPHGAYLVSASIKGSRGEPGSMAVQSTLWVDTLTVRNDAGRVVQPEPHEIVAIYDEVERRAGIT